MTSDDAHTTDLLPPLTIGCIAFVLSGIAMSCPVLGLTNAHAGIMSEEPWSLIPLVLWIVVPFAAAVMGFRARRRRLQQEVMCRGRCPRCGYDLRGNVTNGQDARSTGQDARSTGCPECGWNRSEPGN